MQNESLLTPEERRELKQIFLQLWAERGEGFNRATCEPEVADLWFEAVTNYLTVCENRLNVSNNAAKNSKNK